MSNGWKGTLGRRLRQMHSVFAGQVCCFLVERHQVAINRLFGQYFDVLVAKLLLVGDGVYGCGALVATQQFSGQGGWR